MVGRNPLKVDMIVRINPLEPNLSLCYNSFRRNQTIRVIIQKLPRATNGVYATTEGLS